MHHELRGHIRYCLGVLAVMCFLCGTAGCSSDSENAVRRKLEAVCADDLRTVVEEIPAESVSDSVYYVIRIFKKYREGKYRYMAVADYFFLKNVRVKMVRKYRYHSSFRKWERYFNQYQFVHD